MSVNHVFIIITIIIIVVVVVVIIIIIVIIIITTLSQNVSSFLAKFQKFHLSSSE